MRARESQRAEILRSGLNALRRAGLEAGEIYLHDIRSNSVSYVGGKVEISERRHDLGVGLRGFHRGRVGFSYTSDLRSSGLNRAAHRVAALVEFLPPDPANRLPQPGPRPEVAGNYAPRVEKLSTRRMAGIAAAIEDAARRRVKGLKTRECRYADVWGEIWIAHSGGLRDSFRMSRSLCWAEVIVPGPKDTRQTGFASAFAIAPEELDPAGVGREAADRARAKLGARQPKTAKTAVLLDPTVTAELLSTIAPALHADEVLKGKSFFAGRLGTQVASSQVTLIDDGVLRKGYASAPFDGEGVSQRRTVLIESGMLRGYLHSTYSAARMKTAVTGNAMRDSYTGPPRIDTSNIFLEPSGVKRRELLASVSEGVYITEVMGLHTLDAITGDFSLGASGNEVRGGRLGAPLEKLAIAGNALELLRAVRGVADDLRFFPGGQGGATVLLEDLTVSGR
ncbi:MAG: TldD/PmbA family protein [Acidobacteriota bacterium]